MNTRTIKSKNNEKLKMCYYSILKREVFHFHINPSRISSWIFGTYVFRNNFKQRIWYMSKGKILKIVFYESYKYVICDFFSRTKVKELTQIRLYKFSNVCE